MSKELAKTYDPKGLEDRLYQKWMDNGYFHAKVNPDKKPFTIVMPPPNVTGQLHMGHALDETMQDILIRFKRMQGILKTCVGMERRVRRKDHQPAEETRCFCRLGERTLHNGRRMLQGCTGSIYPSV